MGAGPDLRSQLGVATSPLHATAREDTEDAPLELPESVTLEQMMQRLERQLIKSVLRRCDHHKDRAAKQLGLASSSLFKCLKDWDLSHGEERRLREAEEPQLSL